MKKEHLEGDMRIDCMTNGIVHRFDLLSKYGPSNCLWCRILDATLCMNKRNLLTGATKGAYHTGMRFGLSIGDRRRIYEC